MTEPGRTEIAGHGNSSASPRAPDAPGPASPEVRSLLDELGERVKELRCLYAVSSTLFHAGAVEGVLGEVVRLVPGGFRFPESARARILLADGNVIGTGAPTGDVASAAILVDTDRFGTLEVWYDGPVAPTPAGAFLHEERVLIEGITERIAETLRRRRAELRLVRSEARLRTLIENALDLVHITDETGRNIFVSAAVTPLLGYEVEERVGQRLLDIVHPDDRARVRTVFEHGVSGERAATIEFRVQHRDGGWRWLQSACTNLLNEPAVRGMVIASRDVTERHDLEEQLRHSQKMEAVGRLAGGVAHDFNNVLTAIDGYVDLLIDELPETGTLREYAGEIRRGADRAADLTAQLLAFSRKQVLQPVVLDLNALVGEAERMLRRLIGEDIRIELDLATDLPAVKADPGQVEQVLVNLVVNARDAMPRGGRLHIATTARRLDHADATHLGFDQPLDCVVLRVADTGVGMTREVMERIFDPFFTTKEQGKGTGLGLSTVHGIVTQSGGRIGVASELDGGSTFDVYLPATPTPASTVHERRPAAPAGGGELVLLVEDEPAVRALAQRVLERAGYRVRSAATAAEALDHAAAHDDIRLLVTDVVLPGISGVELAARLQHERPTLRVLYASGYTEDEVVRRGLLDQRIDFLQKPFTPGQLTAKIRDILDRAHPTDGS